MERAKMKLYSIRLPVDLVERIDKELVVALREKYPHFNINRSSAVRLVLYEELERREK